MRSRSPRVVELVGKRHAGVTQWAEALATLAQSWAQASVTQHDKQAARERRCMKPAPGGYHIIIDTNKGEERWLTVR